LLELFEVFALSSVADLTRVVIRTPSGGLHFYFALREGERPRNRARDIGPGLDTRGVRSDGVSAGYVIAAGMELPDGRRYQPVDAADPDLRTPDEIDITEPRPAPRPLLFMATFSASQRQRIANTPSLARAIREAKTTQWWKIFEAHDRERSALHPRAPLADADVPAMKRQAIADLHAEAVALAALTDNRRNTLFSAAARIAKYVAHGVLTANEVCARLLAAWAACGAAAKYGRTYAEGVIRRALELGRNDPLPPLARQFRD
jgi:hypothetical protein